MSIDWVKERGRKIHLDFHTPAVIRNIGNRFNAQEFAQTLKRAKVNVIVIFTECHFGFSYYDTKIGRKHPGLNFDLFGEMVKELHKQDIKAIAYHGTTEAEDIGSRYPEWLQVDSKGGKIGQREGEKFFNFVCLNSPWVQELFWEELREILASYEVDGLWLDWVKFRPDACYCKYCIEEMKNEGLDPLNLQDHAKFNYHSLIRFIKETTEFITKINSNLALYYNGITPAVGNRDLIPFLDYFDVEALPTWRGFLPVSLYSRYLRTLQLPVYGLTARFHKSWGDFGSLPSETQLKYECASAMANGSMCAIGDHLHPDGRLDEAAYNIIGKVFDFVEKREEWCLNSSSVSDLAILADYELDMREPLPFSNNLGGATKALIENHHQFDIIDKFADFSPYKILILPDNKDLLPETIGKLKKFVSNGGNLLVTHESSLRQSQNNQSSEFALSDTLGVNYISMSPYSMDYIRLIAQELKTDLPTMDLVVYGKFVQIKAKQGVRELATIVHPLVEDSHYYKHQAPPSRHESQYPAITLNQYGKGRAVYISPPIFKAYYETNNQICRKIIKNLLGLLLPTEDQILLTNAPLSVEVSLMKKNNMMVIHLVNYHAEKQGGGARVIEQIPPLLDIDIKIKKPFEPARIYLAPSKKALGYKVENGRIAMTVPELHIHQMVVIEKRE
ncbi:beta-galactosidase trimerization domain-containing protein [Candidatus Aerophobetes bacterium]|nr:beta-galactosidase trimerization domain-containing protein [Candidatus Aerophobetes bacterium]